MARVTRRWSASVVPLIVAAVMIVAAAAAGCSEQEQSGKPLHAPEWLDPTLAGWVACSRMIVAGDVVSVRPAGHGRMVTELAVDEWVKPASGPEVATIETADLAAEGVYERWNPGTHLFLQVDVDPASLPGWEFSDRMIKNQASRAGVAHDRRARTVRPEGRNG